MGWHGKVRSSQLDIWFRSWRNDLAPWRTWHGLSWTWSWRRSLASADAGLLRLGCCRWWSERRKGASAPSSFQLKIKVYNEIGNVWKDWVFTWRTDVSQIKTNGANLCQAINLSSCTCFEGQQEDLILLVVVGMPTRIFQSQQRCGLATLLLWKIS